MIREIIKILPFMEMGQGHNIDFAKGKKQMPTTFKEFKQWLRRGR
jgi:hypothetical protein